MYARRAALITRGPSRHTRRTWVRGYGSAGDEDGHGQWFQQLRAEMLGRDTVTLREHLSSTTCGKLIDTLEAFLPAEWCPRYHALSRHVGVGHHLIYFNPSMPANKLLPDGTDPLQDPGAPWVRRMWAGGSLHLRPELYYQDKDGFTLNSSGLCAERIRDVQLRGDGDAAKIIVTIERRFARHDALAARCRAAAGSQGLSQSQLLQQVCADFGAQQHDGQEWGDALFKEVRNLVFLKERTPAELDAIRAGNMPPVRYLAAPTQPDFAHVLTPTRSMLFRFSALTWNAHLIHLDPHYACSVEGHRNMLVHGPLSLTIMLQAITSYIDKHTNATQCFESIEYRNLAPLYCDEEMRVCGKVTKTSAHGSQYEVWIEGPTGGMAVRGTVNAVVKPFRTPLSRVAQGSMAQSDQGGKEGERTSIHPAPRTISDHSSSNGDGLKPVEPPPVLTPFILPQVSPIHHDKEQPTPKLSDQAQELPFRLRRVAAPPSPMVPTMSLHTRTILRRLASHVSGNSSNEKPPEEFYTKPTALIRTYKASPYEETTSPVRLVNTIKPRIMRMSQPSITKVGHTLDRVKLKNRTKIIRWKKGRRLRLVVFLDGKRPRQAMFWEKWSKRKRVITMKKAEIKRLEKSQRKKDKRKLKRLLVQVRAEQRAVAAAMSSGRLF